MLLLQSVISICFPAQCYVQSFFNLIFISAFYIFKQLTEHKNNVDTYSSSHIESLIYVQEEVVKLTEKSLNSVGNSPVLNQLKPPDELKSNILKAQAEAALKVFKNSHRQN